MVAIVAMIIGYLILSDLKVALYIGLGVLLAKMIFNAAMKYSSKIYDNNRYDKVEKINYGAEEVSHDNIE